MPCAVKAVCPHRFRDSPTAILPISAVTMWFQFHDVFQLSEGRFSLPLLLGRRSLGLGCPSSRDGVPEGRSWIFSLYNFIVCKPRPVVRVRVRGGVVRIRVGDPAVRIRIVVRPTNDTADETVCPYRNTGAGGLLDCSPRRPTHSLFSHFSCCSFSSELLDFQLFFFIINQNDFFALGRSEGKPRPVARVRARGGVARTRAGDPAERMRTAVRPTNDTAG